MGAKSKTSKKTSTKKQVASSKKVTASKRKFKGVLITANIAGMPINQKVLSTFSYIAQYNNYDLKVVETRPAIKNEVADWTGVPIASRVGVDTKEIHLNNNCKILNVGVSPLAAEPTGGIELGTRQSIIIASPKQTFKTVPNMETLPRVLMSTGCVNNPVYPTGNKRAEMARLNHLMGAYVIEVKNSEIFFPFNIQALSDGSAIHLGVRYYPNGKRVKLKKSEITRVDGDDHAAENDKNVCALLDHIQKNEVQACRKVSHDTWSQAVSNHHALGQKITQAKSVASGLYKIEQEIEITHKFLADRSKLFDEVVVVPANHNEALDRMLEDGRYVNENVNWLSGHVLALAKYHGVDPVKFATAHYQEFMKTLDKYFESVRNDKDADFKLNSKSSLRKVKFLKKGQSLRFGGVELAHHGDEGGNGAKGTPKAMRQILGASVTGHTHTPHLYNKSAVAGTSTATPEKSFAPSYCKGKPSGWMNSFVFVYAPADLEGEGTVQLCNIIGYEWRVK